jgi:hypothetical protein
LITTQNLAEAFRGNLEIIKLQAQGLTQEDSLIQLPFRGNCLNWIIGHILANRCNMLKVIGVEEILPGVNLDRYQRESEPIQGPEEGVLVLTELMSHLETTQLRLEKELSQETEDSLQRLAAESARPEWTMANWLFFYYFHDCYHTGQTEILRQAAGKNDKII